MKSREHEEFAEEYSQSRFGLRGGSLKILKVTRKWSKFKKIHCNLPGGLLDRNDRTMTTICKTVSVEKLMGWEMIHLLIFQLAAGFGDARNPSNASLPIWLDSGTIFEGNGESFYPK